MHTDPGRLPADVLTLTTRQCGVVRRDQLTALGVSPRTLGRRIADGLWTPRGRRVLVFAGTAAGPQVDALVAAHAVHPAGVLTGLSALAVLGELGQAPWDVLAEPIQPWLLLPRDNRTGALTIRESPGPVQWQAGVPVARHPRIFGDLVRFLPESDARGLVERGAQVRGAAATSALLSQAAEAATGRRGSDRVQRLLALLATGAHSDAEALLVRLVSSAGFTGFIVNMPIRLGGRLLRIDLAFPDRRLAIEVDGRAYHSTAGRFQHDRTRQNLLVAAGWTVLRFTWEDLVHRPEYVLRQIAEMLERLAG